MQPLANAADADAGGAMMNPFSSVGMPDPPPASSSLQGQGDWLLPVCVFVVGMLGILRLLRGIL